MNVNKKTDEDATLVSDWDINATVKEGHIQVKGGSVFYRIYGENKSGVPIIFLHGGPGHDSSTFFRTTGLGNKRPVVYYNQLGSSGSDIDEEYRTAVKAKELFTLERFPDELETVIEYFGFNEFVLAGHSWGSMFAVEFVEAKRPKGLRGLILAGPFLNVNLWVLDAQRLIQSLPDGEAKWKIIKECEALGNYTEEYDNINTIYSNNFFNRTEGLDSTKPSQPEKLNIDGFDIYNHMWGPTEFSCTGTLQGHDSTKYLKNINVPVLYICGEYDSGSPAAAAYYCNLTPNGEVAVIRGTAHESPREAPKEFVRVVNEFMKEIEE